MIIHIPFIFIRPNYNSIVYHLNIRFLFWHFQIIEDHSKRGFFMGFIFNNYLRKEYSIIDRHFKYFAIYSVYPDSPIQKFFNHYKIKTK